MSAAYTTEHDTPMFQVVSVMAKDESLDHIVLQMPCLSPFLSHPVSLIIN